MTAPIRIRTRNRKGVQKVTPPCQAGILWLCTIRLAKREHERLAASTSHRLPSFLAGALWHGSDGTTGTLIMFAPAWHRISECKYKVKNTTGLNMEAGKRRIKTREARPDPPGFPPHRETCRLRPTSSVPHQLCRRKSGRTVTWSWLVSARRWRSRCCREWCAMLPGRRKEK